MTAAENMHDAGKRIAELERENARLRQINLQYGLALERIAYSDMIHEGAEDSAYWPDNVARRVLEWAKTLPAGAIS